MSILTKGPLEDALAPIIFKTIENTIEAVAEEKAIEFKQKIIRDMRKSIGKLELSVNSDGGIPKIEIRLDSRFEERLREEVVA